MFHPSDDLSEADDDFTPEGSRRWTFYRYHQKLSQICKVILASNSWDPPTIICLCELENRQVLQDLVSHPLLIKLNYDILHRESPDHRGIDVAILYRADKIICLDTLWLQTINSQGKYMKTREILSAKFLTEQDTILCITNHWTSKYGGAMETETLRIQQASTLGSYVDSMLRDQPGLCVIAGGDFNDGSHSKSIQFLTKTYGLQEILPKKADCTYKYQGIWESIDHAFIGGKLAENMCRSSVVNISFLLEKDEKYTGVMPFRTYRGFAYNGGISDHLPLLLHFDPKKTQAH